MLYSGMMTSDAKMIKNSKRSAQHQLRDHVELLQASTELSMSWPPGEGGSNFLPSSESYFLILCESWALQSALNQKIYLKEGSLMSLK